MPIVWGGSVVTVNSVVVGDGLRIRRRGIVVRTLENILLFFFMYALVQNWRCVSFLVAFRGFC